MRKNSAVQISEEKKEKSETGIAESGSVLYNKNNRLFLTGCDQGGSAMQTNRKPFFLYVLIAICAALYVWSALRHSDDRGSERENETGTMPKFSEIVYTRPDLAAITADYEALIGDLEGNKLSEKQAVPRLEACYDQYNAFFTMSIVAELRYDHDITDSYYAGEYEWFLDTEPEMDSLFGRLCSASANCDIGEALDEAFWGGWTVDAYRGKDNRTHDETFAELQKKENAILAEYFRVTADATVSWRGEERAFYDLQQDDTLTMKEWNEIASLYYNKYAPVFGDIYLRLVGVRQEQAAYLGMDSYEDYAYTYLYGREYGPEQAEVILSHIQTDLAPLYDELSLNSRWERMRYTEVNEAENLEAITVAADAMGGTIQSACEEMKRYELYDIDISEKKGSSSYQCYLYSYEVPFVFVKTEGFSDDILKFGHEFGHFVEAWNNCDRTESEDLAEVFSQGMEYLLLSYVPEDYRVALTACKLMDTVDTFAEQGSFAEFEHEVYSRPAAEWTPEALEELSLRLAKSYGYFQPGKEEYYAKSWIDVPHFFQRPFYVVSYCVSNDAAFQIYALECEKEGKGLACWNKMLPRYSDSFLKTVMDQGGLEDPFAEDRMQQVAELVRKMLQ